VWYQVRKYSRYEPGHVFDIVVDDLAFKLTFLDCKLGRAAIQRIHGVREPETTAIIRTLVKPGAQVLELGSCEGYFTVIMSRSAGPGGRVVAVEGTPYYFNLLQHNVRLNELPNVDAYNLFLTNSREEVFFDAADKHPYNVISSLEKGTNTAGADKEAVQGTRLSVLLDRIGFVPDYIFMDIEGFEIDVLEDLSERYLAERRPLMVFEVHPAFYKEGRGVELIKKILKSHHYYYRRVAGNLVCFPQET